MRGWMILAAALLLPGCAPTGPPGAAMMGGWEPARPEPARKLEVSAVSDFGGAKGQQELSTAYHGVLDVENVAAGWHVEVNPIGDGDALLGAYVQEAASASALGASIGIAHYTTEFGDTWLVGEAQSEAGELPQGYDPASAWVGAYIPFAVTATAPGDSDVQYVAVWVADLWVSFTTDNSGWTLLPTDGFSVAWEIGLTGAYRRAKVEESIPADHASSRDVRQRVGQAHWFAGADTVVTVSAEILD